MPIVMTSSRTKVPSPFGASADNLVRDMPKPGDQTVDAEVTPVPPATVQPPPLQKSLTPTQGPAVIDTNSSIVMLAVQLPFYAFIAASSRMPGWARLTALGLAGAALYVHGRAILPTGITVSDQPITWDEQP